MSTTLCWRVSKPDDGALPGSLKHRLLAAAQLCKRPVRWEEGPVFLSEFLHGVIASWACEQPGEDFPDSVRELLDELSEKHGYSIQLELFP